MRRALAARKELLMARAALQRLRAAHEARMVREGLRLPRLMAGASVIPLIAGALMLTLRRRRETRPMRFGAWVSLGLGLLRLIRRFFSRR